MTRKDYVILAQGLNVARPDADNLPRQYEGDSAETYHAGRLNAWNNTVRTLASALKLENDRFDTERFYLACGLTAEGLNQ